MTALAVDRSLDLHFKPRDDGKISVYSTGFSGRETFHMDDVPGPVPGHWGAYLRGAVSVLRQEHHLEVGIEGVVDASMPTGGLSSSAAVCTAYLTALADVNGITLEPMELVRAAHRIEREYIGIQNGILDYSANVLSRKDSLLVLDCDTEEYELIPRPDTMEPFTFLLVYSGVTKSLVSTGYNNRVNECQAAAWYVQEAAGAELAPLKETCLRDVDPELYRRYEHQIPGRFRRRAEHFFSESNRVRRGVDAWRSGDVELFGRLMNESGQSSVENYECGSPELVSLFEILKTTPGVYGSRFSGAGFRGFCIALADPSRVEEIEARVRDEYPKRHPELSDALELYTCDTDNGLELVG